MPCTSFLVAMRSVDNAMTPPCQAQDEAPCPESATALETSIISAYAQGREDDKFWHVVALSCSTQREWVVVLRQSAPNTIRYTSKESIKVLKNDPAGTQLKAEMNRLTEKDKRYKLRYVAYDGVDTIMVAQVRDL